MAEMTTGDLALMRDNDGFGGANSFIQSQYLLGQMGKWVANAAATA